MAWTIKIITTPNGPPADALLGLCNVYSLNENLPTDNHSGTKAGLEPFTIIVVNELSFL